MEDGWMTESPPPFIDHVSLIKAVVLDSMNGEAGQKCWVLLMSASDSFCSSVNPNHIGSMKQWGSEMKGGVRLTSR